MCFEWDERFRSEQAERRSKAKVDELIKRSEEATQASQGIPVGGDNQPAKEQEAVTA